MCVCLTKSNLFSLLVGSLHCQHQDVSFTELSFLHCVHVCAAGLQILVALVCEYVSKKQAVWCLTTEKSPAECILLLSLNASSVVCYIQQTV